MQTRILSCYFNRITIGIHLNNNVYNVLFLFFKYFVDIKYFRVHKSTQFSACILYKAECMEAHPPYKSINEIA